MPTEIKPYHDYMEDKAKQILGHSKTLKNKTRFLMMGIEEIVNKTSLDVPIRDVYIKILEAVEINSPKRGESRNPLIHGGAFLIISHADIGDYYMQRIICERAYVLGWEVIKVMQKDYATIYKTSVNPQPPEFPRFFDDFNIGSINCMKVGPLFGSLHGYRFEFDATKYIKDLEPTPDIWQE